MFEYEFFNMDFECLFQVYQWQIKSSFCYMSDVMFQDFYCGFDIDFYVYYESFWDIQKEDYILFKWSKSVFVIIWLLYFILN